MPLGPLPLRGRLAALGGLCAAVAFAPAMGASAFSIGFGIETAGPAQLFGSDPPPVVVLDELSGLGTTTPANSDGVAFWSLDAPASIYQAGLEVARIDSWSVALKEDPFVQNNVALTNTSSFTLVYIVSVLMPIPAFSYDKAIYSSLGVTATDSDGNSTLLVDKSGPSFYRGRVDQSTKLTLDPPGLAITTADCSPFPDTAGCTATSSTGVASLALTPGVAHELQIMLQFALSPGDAVSVTSRFEIASSASPPTPEPATGGLVGLGCVLLALARRRH